jgi:hypothetical protein
MPAGLANHRSRAWNHRAVVLRANTRGDPTCSSRLSYRLLLCQEKNHALASAFFFVDIFFSLQ